MTEDELHGAVVQWLATRSGLTVIKSYQSGQTPDGDYIEVNLTGSVEVREHEQDTEYVGDGDEDVVAAPIIETEWNFSLHAYGAAPTQLLRRLRSAVRLSQINEPLLPAVTIHDTSQIRHVPDFVNQDWRRRAQMDLMLRGLTRDGFVIDVIDEIEDFNVNREG